MAVGIATGDKTADQDADGEDAGSSSAAGLGDAVKVLAGPGRGHGAHRGRVDHVVEHLHRIEAPAFDDAAERGRITEGGEPHEPGLALLFHFLQALGDAAGAEHLFHREGLGAGARIDAVVDLQDVHPIAAQALERGFAMGFDLAGKVPRPRVDRAACIGRPFRAER